LQNSKLQNCRLFFCLGGQFFFATRWKEAPCSACLFCGCTRATFSDDCTCWRNGIILCCVLHFAGTEKNVISASHTIKDSERGFLFDSAFVLIAHATPHCGTSIISYLAPDKCALQPSGHFFFLSGLALLVAIFLWEDQPNQGTKFNRIAIAMNLFNIPSILHLFSQPLERKREWHSPSEFTGSVCRGQSASWQSCINIMQPPHWGGLDVHMGFSNSQGQDWFLQVCSEKLRAQCSYLWLGVLGLWVSYAGAEMGCRQTSDWILFEDFHGSSWPSLACDISRRHRFHVSGCFSFAPSVLARFFVDFHHTCSTDSIESNCICIISFLCANNTVIREKKRDRGNLFAKENGLPELTNVLQPRTRGFVTCLSHLRPSLDAGTLTFRLKLILLLLYCYHFYWLPIDIQSNVAKIL